MVRAMISPRPIPLCDRLPPPTSFSTQNRTEPSTCDQPNVTTPFGFEGARVLHSIFYLWGTQPFRTLSFVVGVVCVTGMAVQVIRAAV